MVEKNKLYTDELNMVTEVKYFDNLPEMISKRYITENKNKYCT